MIDASEHEIATIKRILTEYAPDCEIRVFGSRVNGTAKPHSDLDLVVVGPEKLPQRRYYRLKEAFQESELPFRGDVLDWHRISPEFRRVIDNNYVKVLTTDDDTPKESH